MSITLYDEQSKAYQFAESQPDLQKKYTEAEVTAGTWIFYTEPDYKKGKGCSKIVKPSEDECRVDITSANGSMFLVDAGLILFEGFGYGGERKWFQDSCADVKEFFPPKKVGGVSSAIVLSKNRSVDIFSEPNYECKIGTLQPGEWYEKLKEIPEYGLNDKLGSFKFTGPKA